MMVVPRRPARAPALPRARRRLGGDRRDARSASALCSWSRSGAVDGRATSRSRRRARRFVRPWLVAVRHRRRRRRDRLEHRSRRRRRSTSTSAAWQAFEAAELRDRDLRTTSGRSGSAARRRRRPTATFFRAASLLRSDDARPRRSRATRTSIEHFPDSDLGRRRADYQIGVCLGSSAAAGGAQAVPLRDRSRIPATAGPASPPSSSGAEPSPQQRAEATMATVLVTGATRLHRHRRWYRGWSRRATCRGCCPPPPAPRRPPPPSRGRRRERSADRSLARRRRRHGRGRAPRRRDVRRPPRSRRSPTASTSAARRRWSTRAARPGTPAPHRRSARSTSTCRAPGLYGRTKRIADAHLPRTPGST